MEGLKFVIFGLVFLGWLAIWIIRMFKKAFDQPSGRKPEPFLTPADKSISEVLRQELNKRERQAKEVLEKLDVPVLEENERPKYRSMENLKPQIHSLETTQAEIGQRPDIIRQRREKTVYQLSEKKPVSVYAKMLQNPQTAREAIILAEILKPKF